MMYARVVHLESGAGKKMEYEYRPEISNVDAGAKAQFVGKDQEVDILNAFGAIQRLRWGAVQRQAWHVIVVRKLNGEHMSLRIKMHTRF